MLCIIAWLSAIHGLYTLHTTVTVDSIGDMWFNSDMVAVSNEVCACVAGGDWVACMNWTRARCNVDSRRRLRLLLLLNSADTAAVMHLLVWNYAHCRLCSCAAWMKYNLLNADAARRMTSACCEWTRSLGWRILCVRDGDESYACSWLSDSYLPRGRRICDRSNISLSLSLSLYLCLCVCVSLVSVCQRDDSKSGTRNIHGQSLCHTEEMIKFWARFGKSQTGIGSDCGFTAGYFQKSCGWTAVFCGVAVDVLRDSDCRNLDPGQGLMRITVVNPSLSVSPLNFWPLPPSFLSILHITTSPNFLKNSGVATPNIQLPPSVRAVALSCRVL